MAWDAKNEVKEFFRENWVCVFLGFAIGVAGRFVYDEMNRAKPDHIPEPTKLVIDAEQDRMICNLDAQVKNLNAKVRTLESTQK